MNEDDDHLYEQVEVKGKGKEKTKRPHKQHYKYHTDPTVDCELRRRIDELQGQLSLKQDILESTDKKLSKLFEENKDLKNEMKILIQEKEGADARLRGFGCNIEDGKTGQDQRARAIGAKWDSLYKHEWNAVYDEFCKLKTDNNSHKEVEKQLLEITEWCYETCSKLAEEQKNQIQSSLMDVAAHLNFQKPTSNDTVKSDCVSETLDTLMRYVQHYCSDLAPLEKVKEKCIAEYKTLHKDVLKRELTYVERCSAVCWLMRTTEPHMVLKYKNLERTLIDNLMFDKLNVTGTIVEQVIWPALLRYENGPLLSHGLVRTVPGGGVTGNSDATNCYAKIPEWNVDKEIDLGGEDEKKKERPTESPDVNRYMTMKLPLSINKIEDNVSTKKTPIVYSRRNPFDSNPSNSRSPSPAKDKTHVFQNLSKSVPAQWKGSLENLNISPSSNNKKQKRKNDLTKQSRETFISYT